MKSHASRLAALAAVVILSSCATVGDIPVDFGGVEVIYISPANADGIQDAVTLPVSVIPLERTRLTRYAVTVRDTGGIAVRTYEDSIPDTRRDRRQSSVETPDVVLWDGRNDRGAFVADGQYLMSIQVWDNRDNTGIGVDQRVDVDNTAPRAEVTSPFLLFTPNGDSRLDTLAIYQRRSTLEDEWQGTFTNQQGAVVRTITWEGGALDFEWDGITDAGRAAPAGTYSYKLSSTDRAGNHAQFALSGIQLEGDPRAVRLNPSRLSFSPNGDGRGDTLLLAPMVPDTQGIESWSIEVRDITGEAVRTFTGAGNPATVTFDGNDNDGTALEDGQYVAVLSVNYTGGRRPTTASPTVTIDTLAPRATIRVSSTVFSPDGDGQKDTIDVMQSSSTEGSWTGMLTRSDGSLVRSQTWEGQVGGFVWDGTDSNGVLLPDGTYTYRLESTDEAENVAPNTAVRVRLDTRPVPVQVSSQTTQFSPNGDGLQDAIPFTLSASETTGIDHWVLAIRDSGNQVIGQVASGNRTLPASAQWDGSINGALVADATYTAELQVVYEKGTISTARSNAVRVDTAGPRLTVRCEPVLFSPDDDGTDDVLTIRISATDPSSVARWETSIYDPTGQLFTSWNGTGTPPRTISWDGLSPSGELVQAAEDYHVVVRATDAVWNANTAETDVAIDILVIREGDRLRIRLSSIYFVPFTADYMNLEDREQAEHNLETLDRLAQILARYPQHNIRVEGHAVSLLWYDRVRAEIEQREVLIPLSVARAEAIRAALIDRGVSGARMTTFGYGGSRPIVPHSDETNRWKNRRVEFILER